MTVANVSWNKIIAVCTAFVLPGISVAIWLAVWGTKLADKVDRIDDKVMLQGQDISDLKTGLAALNVKVDTVSNRQRENKRDIDHKFEIQGLKTSQHKTSAFIQRYVDNKLVSIPVN